MSKIKNLVIDRLNIVRTKDFKSQRPKLTEQEDREIADRQLTQWKEDK